MDEPTEEQLDKLDKWYEANNPSRALVSGESTLAAFLGSKATGSTSRESNADVQDERGVSDNGGTESVSKDSSRLYAKGGLGQIIDDILRRHTSLEWDTRLRICEEILWEVLKHGNKR